MKYEYFCYSTNHNFVIGLWVRLWTGLLRFINWSITDWPYFRTRNKGYDFMYAYRSSKALMKLVQWHRYSQMCLIQLDLSHCACLKQAFVFLSVALSRPSLSYFFSFYFSPFRFDFSCGLRWQLWGVSLLCEVADCSSALVFTETVSITVLDYFSQNKVPAIATLHESFLQWRTTPSLYVFS